MNLYWLPHLHIEGISVFPLAPIFAPKLLRLTLCAHSVQAAVGGATVQDGARGPLPESATALAFPEHTVPVAAAVWRLTDRLMDADNG